MSLADASLLSPFGRHGAVAELSAVEFVIARIITLVFCFTQENVDKFVNSLVRQ